MFHYLASRHTLLFLFSYYWCYSGYGSRPLCELSSRLLNDAKECHIAFSSLSSSFPCIYESSIVEKDGHEKNREIRRNTFSNVSLILSYACRDQQLGLLVLIRKCLWYYRYITRIINAIHLPLSYWWCFCCFLCHIPFGSPEFTLPKHNVEIHIERINQHCS